MFLGEAIPFLVDIGVHDRTVPAPGGDTDVPRRSCFYPLKRRTFPGGAELILLLVEADAPGVAVLVLVETDVSWRTCFIS
jgi:hypothetical protein